MIPVVTFWYRPTGSWRREYPLAAINAWARMVRKFIPDAFPIVITDYPVGGIECATYPMWPHPVSMAGNKPNCFVRLRIFSEWFATEFMAHFGLPAYSKFIHLDADCLVRAPLDFIVKCDADLAFCYGVHTPYNPSIVVHKSGTMTRLYETFDPATSPLGEHYFNLNRVEPFPDRYRHYFNNEVERVKGVGSDQVWLSRMAGECPVFTMDDGVWRYVDMVILRARQNGHEPSIIHTPPEVWDGAKIVFFSGEYKPWDDMLAGTRVQKEWMAYAG
jgi:hypothetical protein